jgi:hypothetical protein
MKRPLRNSPLIAEHDSLLFCGARGACGRTRLFFSDYSSLGRRRGGGRAIGSSRPRSPRSICQGTADVIGPQILGLKQLVLRLPAMVIGGTATVARFVLGGFCWYSFKSPSGNSSFPVEIAIDALPAPFVIGRIC